MRDGYPLASIEQTEQLNRLFRVGRLVWQCFVALSLADRGEPTHARKAVFVLEHNVMKSIKRLAELFKQTSGSFGDIARHCEFCQAAPTKWVTVGNVVVFVCETHLGEFLNEVARK